MSQFFQRSVLTKHRALLDSAEFNRAWQTFQAHFHDKAKQANIRAVKEEQYQEGFLRDLFVAVLGYTLKPEPNYNLLTEQKNQTNSKKADAAVLNAQGEVIAVVELKGTKTRDLASVEAQAFGYKSQHPACRYVITANFEKLRFYIDNAVQWREFDLFALSEDDFAELYLCLAHKHLSNHLPQTLKSESVSAEIQITKQLYADYSAFKRELFADLCDKNPQFDKLELFKKSQKLLDRFLFIFFAEDRHLLPPNFFAGIVRQWHRLKEEDAYAPLYERIKIYFNYLNQGHTTAKGVEIYAYNGGLFAPDEILDCVQISDELLEQHAAKLAEYDFASEIDVDILGHIFENSLNEIDEIHAALRGETPDKSQNKRKKDGVFYTPKYITQYMVRETVGKLCCRERERLNLRGEDYTETGKISQQTKKQRLELLQTYRAWLLDITICDPACGSGAFLNEALNFLIDEHRRLDEWEAALTDSSMVYANVELHILENNLFGVDINDESVEIAKLSLWLRTAQRGRKLNNLNRNIICGNSLISDPNLDRQKALDFQAAFPKVFAAGGFDVIIGNPPYVKLEHIRQTSEQLAQCGFETYDKRGDLYVLFAERGFDLLKNGGVMAYIMPNKWLQAGYGAPLRRFFLRGNRDLQQLIDFGDVQIFEGATTYPCIFVLAKQPPQREQISIAVLKQANSSHFVQNVADNLQDFPRTAFDDKTWVISSNQGSGLIERLSGSLNTLESFIGGEVYYGIKTGLNEAFIIDAAKRAELIAQDPKSAEIIQPMVAGRDLSRYLPPKNVNYLIATLPALKLNIDDYPAVKAHLLTFGKERLEQSGAKGSRKKTNNAWFELQDTIAYYKEFSKSKIVYQSMQVSPCFTLSENEMYGNDKIFIIPSENKGLLAILNSKFGWWLIAQSCARIRGGYQLIWKQFKNIPIAAPTEELANLADKMMTLTAQADQAAADFLQTLRDHFPIAKVSTKLQNWHAHDFADLLAELKKQKHEIPLPEHTKWRDYFTTERDKIRKLQTQAAATDQAINKAVYALYGLSGEEIAMVEAFQ